MSAGDLRVAIDATPLLGPRTGVAVVAAALLDHLPDEGISPIVYATSWRGRGELAALAPEGVAVAGRPQAARPLWEMWSRFDAPPIEWWTGRVEVVHGTNFVVPPTRRAAALATVHDLTFHHHPEMSTSHTLRYPTLIRRALGRGAWIHTVSQFVADEVVEVYDADPDRIVAIHNGVTPLPPADPTAGHRLVGGDRYVIAVGTVEPRKDLPLLVAAFDRLAADDPDLRLVIAGPDGWGADALTERVGRSPHRDRVVRLGWVSDADRAALVRGATALTYPSRYEGFGLVPLEAMSAEVPVVATAVGAIPEVVGDAALLVPPADPDALADALARVLDDDAVRRDLTAKGLARAAAFTWESCARQMAQLYRRIAG